MGLLLVVLVSACALASAAQIGRGFWVRARSVKRHQQALETLADMTQGPEAGSPPAPLGTGSPKADHQAHVRVIGPGGAVETVGAQLPPPRPFARSGLSAPSPLRRPSRHAPSAASIDAVTASATLPGAEGAKLVRTRSTSPVVLRATPPTPPPAAPAPAETTTEDQPAPSERYGYSPGEETIPGLFPQPPATAEPPTRPVAIIRPHTFYFDDLSGRPPPEQAAGTGVPVAGAGGEPPQTAPSVAPGRAYLPGRRFGAPRWLAAAAVLAILAAAGATLALARPPGKAPAHLSSPPTTHASATKPTVPPPPTTGAPAVTSTSTSAPPQPPKPAVLLGTAGGTATYQLTSASASIVVEASGPCWIEVRVGSRNGPVIYQGTLESGMASKVTGPAWMRLGDPVYAHVLVDGAHMAIPGATKAVPVNLVFTLG
ncbi:MAG TPA: RodZ domain-containing protein [Acidimicrobiales bacterium]|nr:RodZ domain-containing protein [Acidimicrobiales bacterium]